jgi:hypothetical protein
MKTHEHFRSHLAQFLEWEMFQTTAEEKIKTHTPCSIMFFSFSENRAVYEICGKIL